MIISRIQLHPFAGIADQEVLFEPGLNVIVGPNESGKSTVINALRTVLLQSTEYKKKIWTDQLSRYVPHGGGDAFRVSLDFRCGSRAYKLCRQWGEQRHCHLTLPGGQLLTSAEAVQQQLDSLLELKPGTWDHVLFAYQAHLANTLDHLRDSPSEKADLAHLMRSAVLATDGVSLEDLNQQLSEALEKSFSRWDAIMQRPEGNRGVENPWKINLGQVVNTWYQLKTMESERDRIAEYEVELDGAVTQIKDLNTELADLHEHLKRWEPAVDAEDVRDTLNERLIPAKAAEAKLLEAVKNWPARENEKTRLMKDIAISVQNLSKLDEEFKLAQNELNFKDKRQKLKLARRAQTKLDDARTALETLTEVSADALRELQNLDAAIKQHQASLSAGKLLVRMKATKEIELQTATDLDPPQQLSLTAGENYSLTAGGRVILTYPDWEIEITSGDLDFLEIERQLNAVEKSLKGHLEGFGLPDLKAASKAHTEWDAATQRCETFRNELQTILQGETIEQLAADLKGDIPSAVRDIGQVSADRDEEIEKREGDQGRLKAVEEQLDSWVKDYGSWEAALDQHKNASENRQKIEEELSQLPRLPPEIQDKQAFLKEFQDKKERLRLIETELLPEAKVRRVEIESRLPQHSLAEAEELLAAANADFQHAFEYGRAVQRIKSVFDELKAELDAGTLNPWLSSLQSVTEQLTSGRYSQISLEQGHVQRGTEFTLSHALLSMGTRSCLGLAMRLSMAEYFLKDRDGFLVLDDPMVDLDAERQRTTAEVLQRFAGNKQVIIVTCHEQHADLLKGHQIRFSHRR